MGFNFVFSISSECPPQWSQNLAECSPASLTSCSPRWTTRTRRSRRPQQQQQGQAQVGVGRVRRKRLQQRTWTRIRPAGWSRLWLCHFSRKTGMDKSLLMFRKLYFSHPAGLVCITASFNRLTLQRCFFHCSVSKSTMPLPAFFLRQLRRRGLLIGLAGLAIVLVVAQVRKQSIFFEMIFETFKNISFDVYYRSTITGPHSSHMARRGTFSTWESWTSPSPGRRRRWIALSLEMNHQGVKILKYFKGEGEEREQGGGGDLQELCTGEGEHCWWSRFCLW